MWSNIKTMDRWPSVIWLLILLISTLNLFSCKSIRYKHAIKNTPNEIKIDSHLLKLKVMITQNNSPGSGNDRIQSINILVDENQNDISNRFKLTKQCVIKDNKIWISKYLDTPSKRSNILTGKSKDGPRWKFKEVVSIICYFRDEITQIDYRIKFEDKMIGLIQ